jgi:YfiH family protein
MNGIVVNDLPLFQFRNLAEFPDLFNFSTTRRGGVSSGSYQSLNLGFNSGDHPDEVIQNREILSRSLNIPSAKLIFPKQVHSPNIRFLQNNFLELSDERKKELLKETDALITDVKGLCIAIKTADCVPVLLYDCNKKVIAAIHAGWRGTVQNITALTVQKMVKEAGCNPLDIYAAIGPSISPSVYEVGSEVWEQFGPDFYHQNGSDNKRLLNLWKANFSQLIQSGVPFENIEIAEMCTYSDSSLFFSARRDGVKTGRMATGIMMKN